MLPLESIVEIKCIINVCSLCVHCVFTVHSLCVHCAFTVCVCVFWPPVQDELLLSMRFQSLVLTSMTSPPYPRPQ